MADRHRGFLTILVAAALAGPACAKAPTRAAVTAEDYARAERFLDEALIDRRKQHRRAGKQILPVFLREERRDAADRDDEVGLVDRKRRLQVVERRLGFHVRCRRQRQYGSSV